MTSNTKLSFRVAAPEDAAAIAQLVQAAFRAEESGTAWTGPDVQLNRTFTMSPDEVLSTINNPNADFLMASTSDGTLVGAMAAVKRSNELARLAMLAVSPTYQGGGLGRQILANAEKHAQEKWGIKKIGLNALNTRALLMEWYERRGYVKTGEKSPFPVKALRGIELPDDLHFVEMEKIVQGTDTDGKV